MMANPHWHNNDPLDNKIRQTVNAWESSPPSDWDTPPADLWQKIAPASAAPVQGAWFYWKWIAGALTVAGVAALTILLYKAPIQEPAPRSVHADSPAVAATASPSNQHASLPEMEAQHIVADPAVQPSGKEGEKASLVIVQKTIGLVNARQVPGVPKAGNSEKASPPKYPTVTEAVLSSTEAEANELPVVLPAEEENAQVTGIGAQKKDAVAGLISAPDEIPTALSAAQEGNAKPGYVLSSPALHSTPLYTLDYAGLLEDEPSFAMLPARRARTGGRFFAGAFVSPNRTFRQIQSSRPTNQLPAFLRDNEFASWTTEWGVRAGWKLNRRLAFSTGIGLYSMAQQSLHRFRIPFDPGRERPLGNNNFQGNYSLSVPSAYGDATVEVGVQRPGSQNILAGQFLAVEMRTDLSIKYITMPLNAYYFLSSGRVSVGFKAGAAVNFLQEETLTARARITQRGLASRTVAVQRGTERTERMTMDYQLGAALWYRPAAGWMVSVEPSFRHSLGPVMERELFSVSQYAIGIQAGIQKIF